MATTRPPGSTGEELCGATAGWPRRWALWQCGGRTTARCTNSARPPGTASGSGARPRAPAQPFSSGRLSMSSTRTLMAGGGSRRLAESALGGPRVVPGKPLGRPIGEPRGSQGCLFPRG
eukprot:76936-Pyramimonas_sp.AAC.1